VPCRAATARHLARGQPARRAWTVRRHTGRGERGERERGGATAARHAEPGSPGAGAHGHAQHMEAAVFGARHSAATSGERG